MKTFLRCFFLILVSVSYAQSYEDSPNLYRFRYRSKVFKGPKVVILKQLQKLKSGSRFESIPPEYQAPLIKKYKKAVEQPIPRIFKRNTVDFLDALYEFEEFLDLYEEELFKVVFELKKDMKRLDIKFEQQLTKSKILLDRTVKEFPDQEDEIKILRKDVVTNHKKLLSHQWMKKKFKNYKALDIVRNPDDLMQEFKTLQATAVYDFWSNKQIDKIRRFLENEIIEFYHQKSIPEIENSDVEFNFLGKTQN